MWKRSNKLETNLAASCIAEVNTETYYVLDKLLLQKDDMEEKWKSESDKLRERGQLLPEIGSKSRDSVGRRQKRAGEVENGDGKYSVGKIDGTQSSVWKRRKICFIKNSDGGMQYSLKYDMYVRQKHESKNVELKRGKVEV